MAKKDLLSAISEYNAKITKKVFNSDDTTSNESNLEIENFLERIL